MPSRVEFCSRIFAAEPADILSAEERLRATRFSSDQKRRQFTAARSALRTMLGGELGCDAIAVIIDTDAFGKPFCNDPRAPAFSVSHSHAQCALAWSRAGAVGVDIELCRPRPRADAIAARYFSTGEQAAIGDAEDRLTRFYEIWTAKEAVIKARGRGFFADPRDFDVTADFSGSLVRLRAPEGYTAAAYVEAADVSPSQKF